MTSAESTHVCRLTPDAINGIVERSSRRTVAILGLAVAAGFFAVLKDMRLDAMGFGAVLGVMAFLFALVIFAYLRTLKRLYRTLASYTVIAGPDSLIRKQAGFDDLQLARGDVSSAVETEHALVVRGAGRAGTIVVFRGVEGYALVKERIALWTPVAPQPRSRMLRRMLFRSALIVLFGGAILGVLWSSDPRVVLPLSAPAATILVWSFWSVQRDRMVDRRTKRSSWLMLLPLAAIVIKAYMLLA